MVRYLRGFTLVVGLVAVAFLPMAWAQGLEWPVQNKVLTATFGENRWDHFHDGIDIGGGEQQVHPAADGQVLFTFDEGRDTRDLPTGLGTFMVIQHNQGYRTLYAHMRRGSVLVNTSDVTTHDVIGIMGDTGDSLGRHLHFEVIDRATDEIVNPLTLLPPLADTTRPVIQSVSIERNKKLTPLAPFMAVDGGDAELVVDVYDPSQYVAYFDPMAPYGIEASINGREIFNITYDALKDTDGRAYLIKSDNRDFSNFYLDTWTVRLGSFSLKTGAANLVVTARDFAGNETTKTFHLTVLGTNGQ